MLLRENGMSVHANSVTQVQKKVIFQITSNANVSVSVRFIKLRLTQIRVHTMKKNLQRAKANRVE